MNPDPQIAAMVKQYNRHVLWCRAGSNACILTIALVILGFAAKGIVQ